MRRVATIVMSGDGMKLDQSMVLMALLNDWMVSGVNVHADPCQIAEGRNLWRNCGEINNVAVCTVDFVGMSAYRLAMSV